MRETRASQTGQNPSSEQRKRNPNPTPPQEAVCNGYLRGNGKKYLFFSEMALVSAKLLGNLHTQE